MVVNKKLISIARDVRNFRQESPESLAQDILLDAIQKLNPKDMCEGWFAKYYI